MNCEWYWSFNSSDFSYRPRRVYVCECIFYVVHELFFMHELFFFMWGNCSLGKWEGEYRLLWWSDSWGDGGWVDVRVKNVFMFANMRAICFFVGFEIFPELVTEISVSQIPCRFLKYVVMCVFVQICGGG